MAKKNTINLGVIGMGPNNMASTLMLLKNEPDLRFRVQAICSRRRNITEQCARDFGVPFWTTDYRKLVIREDVDVVCVYSPDHLHAGHCIAALKAGKHVVCTKPMVTRLEDAKKLRPKDILKRLGGLPKIKIHCSVLGDQALRAAIMDYESKK